MKFEQKILVAAVLAAILAPSLTAEEPRMDFDRGFDFGSVMLNSVPLAAIPAPVTAEPAADKCGCDVPAYANERKGNTKIAIIEGIGPIYAEKLRAESGITTLEELLEAGATAKGRLALEKRTGIGHKRILKWVNLADLMRVKGIGEEYSDLLEAAGVDTVKELRRRVPENLHQKMSEVNALKNLARRPPALSDVAGWILRAKCLPPLVAY